MFDIDVFFRPVSKQHFGRPWKLARSQPEFELIDLKIFYTFFFLVLFFSYFIFCIGKKKLQQIQSSSEGTPFRLCEIILRGFNGDNT